MLSPVYCSGMKLFIKLNIQLYFWLYLSKKKNYTFDCVSGWYYHVSAYNGRPPEKGYNRRVLPLPAADSGAVVGSVFCIWTLG